MQTGAELLSWDSVTARLLQEYDEKQWNRSSEGPSGSSHVHALYSASHGSGFRSNINNRNPIKGACHFCGEHGHFIRNCPKKIVEIPTFIGTRVQTKEIMGLPTMLKH